MLAAGAITIPIYPSNLPDECGYILWNSESGHCVVENAAQLQKIEEVLDHGFEIDGRRQRIELRGLLLIDGQSDDPRVTTLAKLRESGRQALTGGRGEIDARVGRMAPHDVATIVYTSGPRVRRRAWCRRTAIISPRSTRLPRSPIRSRARWTSASAARPFVRAGHGVPATLPGNRLGLCAVDRIDPCRHPRNAATLRTFGTAHLREDLRAIHRPRLVELAAAADLRLGDRRRSGRAGPCSCAVSLLFAFGCCRRSPTDWSLRRFPNRSAAASSTWCPAARRWRGRSRSFSTRQGY